VAHALATRWCARCGIGALAAAALGIAVSPALLKNGTAKSSSGGTSARVSSASSRQLPAELARVATSVLDTLKRYHAPGRPTHDSCMESCFGDSSLGSTTPRSSTALPASPAREVKPGCASCQPSSRHRRDASRLNMTDAGRLQGTTFRRGARTKADGTRLLSATTRDAHPTPSTSAVAGFGIPSGTAGAGGAPIPGAPPKPPVQSKAAIPSTTTPATTPTTPTTTTAPTPEGPTDPYAPSTR
jgi:hypothetical protein